MQCSSFDIRHGTLPGFYDALKGLTMQRIHGGETIVGANFMPPVECNKATQNESAINFFPRKTEYTAWPKMKYSINTGAPRKVHKSCLAAGQEVFLWPTYGPGRNCFMSVHEKYS